ncbi:hypothetical protein K4K56_011309 [Colletotrichum sp. SAR 10_98]|nr:hypothetical protein K4K55_001739 [Colletotrichum sp. SAR 10_96]KAI8282113.1 hypothetical protein K4K56_011309 [Colletotrichum sp. SAR 10_98]
MPSILSDDDKETVKRFVPKQTNKIQAVAVARLYVAYPNPAKWTYTGIQGAIVLSNDLVGNTYWLKMVDISSANRGVIWDQEIFESWSYNQDRTYFHSFEIEECLAGLSFMDEKEAKQFKKKMDDREKNASRGTRATPFGGAAQSHPHKHGLLGGLFGSRHASAPTPPDSPRAHGRMPSLGGPNGHKSSEFAVLDAFDSNWRENFGQDLRDKGLTDEFIKENQEFIVDFLKEEQEKLMAGARSHTPASLRMLWEAPSVPFAGRQMDRLRLHARQRHLCKKKRDPRATAALGGPPAPPMPNRDSGYSSGVPAPAPDAGRSGMLADIQKAGGIKALKKVDRSQIRDRSGASVGGSNDTGPHGSGLPPAGVAPGGGGDMANALAAALQKRKEKVSRSDDESDNDDW